MRGCLRARLETRAGGRRPVGEATRHKRWRRLTRYYQACALGRPGARGRVSVRMRERDNLSGPATACVMGSRQPLSRVERAHAHPRPAHGERSDGSRGVWMCGCVCVVLERAWASE
eukprot:1577766-Pyramimonas_sp.AAC.1